jgi:hypothetical protein
MTTAAPLRPQRLATRGGSSPRTAFVLSAPRASERCKLGCATHNLLKLQSHWIANTAEIHSDTERFRGIAVAPGFPLFPHSPTAFGAALAPPPLRSENLPRPPG